MFTHIPELTDRVPNGEDAYRVTATTDYAHAFSEQQLTPGLVKWVDESPEMSEDIGEWFLPMDMGNRPDGTPAVLIGAHRYGGEFCMYCGIGAMDWDLQEYPCNRD